MAEKTVPPDLDRRLFRKLRTIDDATSGRDLRVPSGNRFEKLSGNPKVIRSIRVNR